MATEFLRLRPAIVIPFMAFAVLVLALAEGTRTQAVGLGCAATVAAAVFLHERRTGRRRPVTQRGLLRSLVATALGISVGCALTGALQSPLLPMLFAPVGVGFAAFGRSRASGILLGVLVFIVALLAAFSPLASGLVLPDASRRIILAVAMVDAALLLRVGVASLAAAHGRAAQTLAVAGDEMIRAAVARSRALETLGSQVAHEVKNPLAAIRALVEVMLEAGDERTRKRLTVAAGEIRRIEQIVESYGSLARPLETVRRARVDVSELVEGLAAVLEAGAERRGVAIRADVPAGSSRLVFELDRDRVKEALLNLVLNALDATPPGGTVTLAPAIAPDGWLELRVTDTGKGMSAATLAKVGTPFFTEREGGTGLGVALARKVAVQHGGELSYVSVPGAGTTATFRIPRTAKAEESDNDAPDRSHL